MSGKVMHFELPVDDVDRAGRFYSEVFGWAINKVPEMGSTMVGTTPSNEYGQPIEPGGINGGFSVRGNGPITHPVVTVHVDDIDETLKRVEKLGGKRVQDKTPVGNIGFVSYFTDTEGSLVGLWQFAQG
jgi:predicted enzyme related to lactoylglutathione lyase